MNMLTIGKHKIAKGENKTVKLRVGKLPSGTSIFVHVHVYRSLNPGSVILFMGGLHGDEINGVEIIRQACKDSLFDNIKCGTVVAIPLLNVYGFLNFSRDTPDGKDVNRSFPGHLNGSLSARVARTITKYVLPSIDFGVDFHTGSNAKYNYPQVRYSQGNEKGLALAKQFSAPLIIAKNIIPKTFREASDKLGVPIIVYEGGESLRYDAFSIREAMNGIKRVLKANDMIDSAPAQLSEPIFIEKSSWIRAAQAGMYMWKVSSGITIKKGDILGEIHDPFGGKSTSVISKKSGFIIGHNNVAVVHMGDALFHLGTVQNK